METWFEDELSNLLPLLNFYARRLTLRRKELAEDLVQDTVEQALTGWSKFTRGTNMRAWLFTIMRHTYFRYRDKEKAEAGFTSWDEEDAAPTLPSVPPNIAGLLWEDGCRLLSILSPEHRKAILLTCVHGLSVEEAAELLGIGVGTVKSRVHRARLKMAKALDANLIPPRTKEPLIRSRWDDVLQPFPGVPATYNQRGFETPRLPASCSVGRQKAPASK